MAADGLPVLKVDALEVRRGARVLCRDLSFTVRPRSCWVVLGPNGAGKSTLLLTLAGLLPAAHGGIELCGAPLSTLDSGARARRRAFLGAQTADVFSATVFDAVLAGRHPHAAGRRRFFAGQWESGSDLAAAQRALTLFQLDAFAARDVRTLSAGERQRVAFAALLAQAPQLYLLDEPAGHLDPAQQIAALDTLLAQARAADAAVVMALHELHLATRYAEQVILIGDGQAQHGPAEAMLTIKRLSGLFGTPMAMLEGDGVRSFAPRSSGASNGAS